MGAGDDIRPVARNRKAFHDYHIEETIEAGIKLTGTEAKSLRSGRASLRDSYAAVANGEAFLYNMHIAPYSHGNRFNHEPKRPRKLLLHRRQIDWLLGVTRQKGLTLVPLRVYFRSGWAKIELGVARGKKTYDKRRDIAEREADRRMRRAMSERYE